MISRIVRPYDENDLAAVAELFTTSVHELGAAEYDAAQREAWAPLPPDLEDWRTKLARLTTLVADVDGELAGFASYEPDGHVEYLFTSPKFARGGTATALLSRVESELRAAGVGAAYTEASRVARPFFERQGFHLQRAETVERRGQSFERFRMRKSLTDDLGASALDRARDACGARDWTRARELLVEADRERALGPEGLELLAECARWTGHMDGLVDPLERAHAAYVAREDDAGAVRTGLALCFTHEDAGRTGLVNAWWKRVNTLIARLPEGPEHALHAWYENRSCASKGDLDGQEERAERALELARRYDDRDVESLALIDLAQVATSRGDEALALERCQAATSLALGGEIGIFAAGVVFCNAILVCRCNGDWQRAQEWTDSSSRWVAREQVDYFPGMCRVHRSEVLRIRGDLAAAEEESQVATRMVERVIPSIATFPWAELGEVRRRRGDLEGAMSAFRRAIALGWDPQPGLALLLLEQGDARSAHRSMEQLFGEPRPTYLTEDRANLLAARATIALAASETSTAEGAADELERLAERNGTPWYVAHAAHARGILELAAGRAARAVDYLNRARRAWSELDAPYELARTCVELGRAFDAEGDRALAAFELGAARDVFERIGAERERKRAEERLLGLAGAAPARSTRSGEPATARMEREGDTWALEFGGRTVRLQSTIGLEYLARLLTCPGTECWAIDLAAPGGAVDRGDAGEVLDDSARAAYRRRAEELEEELADLDARTAPARVEAIRTELDAIGSELAAAVGLGGRARRSGGAVERARQSVTKGIRGAIKKITALHAELGRYLQATIRTGTACRFEPELREPVAWTVQNGGPGS